MRTDEDSARENRQPDLQTTEPSVRPLGYIAVGVAVLSLLLAPTYFFSLYAYIAAAPALVLGFLARTDASARRLGTTAIALALVAIIGASVILAT